jgi:hypothetical protein
MKGEGFPLLYQIQGREVEACCQAFFNSVLDRGEF